MAHSLKWTHQKQNKTQITMLELKSELLIHDKKKSIICAHDVLVVLEQLSRGNKRHSNGFALKKQKNNKTFFGYMFSALTWAFHLNKLPTVQGLVCAVSVVTSLGILHGGKCSKQIGTMQESSTWSFFGTLFFFSPFWLRELRLFIWELLRSVSCQKIQLQAKYIGVCLDSLNEVNALFWVIPDGLHGAEVVRLLSGPFLCCSVSHSIQSWKTGIPRLCNVFSSASWHLYSHSALFFSSSSLRVA